MNASNYNQNTGKKKLSLAKDEKNAESVSRLAEEKQITPQVKETGLPAFQSNTSLSKKSEMPPVQSTVSPPIAPAAPSPFITGRLLSEHNPIIDIYEAEQVSLQRRVIEKRFKPKYQKNTSIQARFESEAKQLARLNHPNLIQIIDYNKTSLSLFLEDVAGHALDDVLKLKKQFSLDEAIRIVLQILNGLSYAHQHRIYHRHLSVQNIILTPQNQIKIADLGLATIVESSENILPSGEVRPHPAVGVPPYLAPEQIQGVPIDQRADLYTVGVILYFLTTSKLPFQGTSPNDFAIKTLQEQPQAPALHNPQILPSLNQIILQALEKKPEKRFQTAEAFADALTLYLSAIPQLDLSQNAAAPTPTPAVPSETQENHNATKETARPIEEAAPQQSPPPPVTEPQTSSSMGKYIGLALVAILGGAAGMWWTSHKAPAPAPVIAPPPPPPAPISVAPPAPKPQAPTEDKAKTEKEEPNLFSYEYVKARAEDGDPQAQFLLGMMYRDGEGGAPHDLEQAKRWFKESSDAGNQQAKKELAALTKKETPKNHKKEQKQTTSHTKDAKGGLDDDMKSLDREMKNLDREMRNLDREFR